MRGSVNQRAKDTWQIRYDAPPTGDGRRKYVAETVKGTKKDAERVLRERLAAIDGKAHIPSHRRPWPCSWSGGSIHMLHPTSPSGRSRVKGASSKGKSCRQWATLPFRTSPPGTSRPCTRRCSRR